MVDEVKAPVQPDEPQAGTAGSAPAQVEDPTLVSGATETMAEDGGETDLEPTGEPGSEPEGHPKTVKEVIKLRKRAQTAELENAELKGMLKGMEMVGGARPPVPGVTPTPPVDTAPSLIPEKEPVEPKPDDFESYDDYVKADRQYIIDKTAWTIGQAYRQTQEREEKNKRAQSWATKVEEAVKKYPDFVQAISNPMFHQTEVVATLIQESDVGTDVAYFLAKNPAEARRLNTLPPILAAREFGKLEKQLSTPAASPGPRKLISQAPEPAKPVEAAGVTEKNEQDLPVEDFISRRNARELARRRGQTI